MLKAVPVISEKNRILLLTLKFRTQKFINICQITYKQAHSFENYFKQTQNLSKSSQMKAPLDCFKNSSMIDKIKKIQRMMKASKKIRKFEKVYKKGQKKKRNQKIHSKSKVKTGTPQQASNILKDKNKNFEVKNSKPTECLQEIKNVNIKQQKTHETKSKTPILQLQEAENIPNNHHHDHDQRSLQSKQIDRNLQNQMLYHSYSINQFFGQVIDCFRRSFTINDLDVPLVCKTNEKNALITMLNQFMLYIRAFKVDLKNCQFKKELEKNVIQNLKEISAKFHKFKNIFPAEERERICEEIEYMDKILKQKADFNDMLKLKQQEEIFIENTDSSIQKGLSDFVGNMIHGINVVEKLRSSFENSKDETPMQILNKLKLEIDEKLQNPCRLFKANEIFPFFADLLNHGLLKKNFKIIVNLVGKMDQEDFKNYYEEIEKSITDPDDIRVFFCEFIEEINNKKMFLL